MPDEKYSGLVVVGDETAGVCVDGVCAVPGASTAERHDLRADDERDVDLDSDGSERQPSA
ncbi:hypothetical protein [Phytoactinopolyspora halotolerans]|uniref:Uncharacterized protein n=1 Tax=Phytoactinopolyspora halotolerans TaxID=1981512 RepID=A0A6L9SBM8_9ACTN|nr:hypothetical protein [Phytoactinopolyspora halotolerans]NEE02002.1 hypothetical protein [Phytoactinopolyspora halotolerans]